MEPAQASEKGGVLEGPEQSDDARGAFSLPAKCTLVSMGTRPGKRNPGVGRDLWKITPGRLGPAALILGLDCESEFMLCVPPPVKKQEMFQTPQSLI